jgi:hypothetical protein
MTNENSLAHVESALKSVACSLAQISQKSEKPMTKESIDALLRRCMAVLDDDEKAYLANLAAKALGDNLDKQPPEVTETRPQTLECDVVRFQNNKEKWVAFVGLLDGRPYEIFTGLQDDEEGIMLPKTVTHGKILKQVNPDGTKRYDFQFENKRGYKTTVEGLSEKFNPEYWNYAKLISGVLRYRMPIEHVVKLVGSLQLQSENINTWKIGVERALKKYTTGGNETADANDGQPDVHSSEETTV